jgi:hypothetical protein
LVLSKPPAAARDYRYTNSSCEVSQVGDGVPRREQLISVGRKIDLDRLLQAQRIDE